MGEGAGALGPWPPPPTHTKTMFPELDQELAALAAQALRRRLQVVETVLPGGRVRVAGQVLLNLSSNDYLGLAQDPRLIAGAQEAAARWGVGAGASRLVAGHLGLHEDVEKELAAFKDAEAAVLFSTGYMANLGVITALMSQGDVIFSDRLNHASIMDGIRLSGATLHRFPHRDMNQLEKILRQTPGGKRRLIITDSVFSVDGDLAPLWELVALKERYGAWLMIDEAHATGVLGPGGAGLAQALGLAAGVDIHMGTLSKALGSLGGYVAGERRLIDYLHNKARSFIYTTAMPPPVLGAIQAALRVVREEPDRRLRLLQEAEKFRRGLQDAGFDTLGSETQIVPVLVGKNEPALEFAAALRARGLMAVALRPPTVPPGRARVRFSLSAAHSPADLARALQIIVATGQEMGIVS